MDNNLLFEVSKFIDTPVGISKVQEAVRSREQVKRNRIHVHDYLDKKLRNRPTTTELESKNILRYEVLSFNKIHEVLNKIDFSTNKERRISPTIANKISKLDFQLRRKILINKLGLEEFERLYK